tara:strand:- start:1306 stop:1797 length:492 start_codon:yes stop_codon:yes gene_type:complete
MTDSNINPPETNAVPGIEVTQTPGIIPEELGNTVIVPPTEGGTTLIPPDTSGVGGHDADVQIGLDDITAIPTETYVTEDANYLKATETVDPEKAHQAMMADPVYAVATHEHQLNKMSDMMEELVTRLISLEKKVLDMEEGMMGIDTNNPISDYPEVQMHQSRG